MNTLLSSLAAGLLTLWAVRAPGAELVVIGNLNAAAPTKDQVAGVYMGKNHSFTPLDQPESAVIRADFYRKVTGQDLAQVKAAWARLTFSGRGQPPKELADAAAVKKAVAADPKAVGYIDKADLDASVKVVLALN